MYFLVHFSGIFYPFYCCFNVILDAAFLVVALKIVFCTKCLLNYFSVVCYFFLYVCVFFFWYIKWTYLCRIFLNYAATCAFQMNDWMNEWIFFGTQMQPWFMIWNNIEHWKIYGVRSIPFRANQKCTKIQQRTHWIQNPASCIQHLASSIQYPTFKIYKYT